MATARHLPLWTVIAPLVGWLLLGAAAAVTHGLHPLALSAGLIACVLAAVHHAEVVAHRVGEPFGTLVLPNTTTSVAGPIYSSSQLAIIAVASLVLYGAFVVVRTVRTATISYLRAAPRATRRRTRRRRASGGHPRRPPAPGVPGSRRAARQGARADDRARGGRGRRSRLGGTARGRKVPCPDRGSAGPERLQSAKLCSPTAPWSTGAPFGRRADHRARAAL